MAQKLPQEGSRDLSSVFDQVLTITLAGVLKKYTADEFKSSTLAFRVALAIFRTTGAKAFSPPKNPKESDWEIVSFNLEKGELVVKYP